ncbi:hypothetical protein SAMN05421788_11672 [Filimonas lacunae]|uniref:Uncharacterized protein n=1 Tax=Filimonas lacunae TaxID=477680 RepID=A0A173MH17_9BACT|nr:hypothetical protein [Filimonas lacunae]BAV06721.1 hypothetical protein FLA_2741 [Filimonas lacunae]SIT34463.1 hypothetical protein SAMN05421788_11672 [Filimonas lacunae]
MLYTDACIYFIIGIVTVAYPLLLTAFSRLDDSYKSSIVLSLFRQEKRYSYFNRVLIIALCAGLLHIIIHFIVSSDKGNDFSETCPLVLITGITLLSITILLSIYTIRLVSLMLQYFSIEKLVLHLQNQPDTEEYRHFRALTDILNVVIQRGDETTVETLLRYYHSQFLGKRQPASNRPLIYPKAFYIMLYNLVRDLTPNDIPKLRRLAYAATNGTWLLGEMQHTEISTQTYSCLWNLKRVLVANKRDDLLMNYWEMSHQYMTYVLRDTGFRPIVNIPDDPEAIPQVNSRQKDKHDFLYFHLALGSLLLYEQNYSCLNRVLRFTNSEPPAYDLLPGNIGTLLSLYRETVDDFIGDTSPIEFRFPFPRTEGLQSSEIIKKQIIQYLALLLIRFYTIPSPYYGFSYTSMPQPPNDLPSLKWYEENLPYFISAVTRLLADATLLSHFQLEHITPDFCQEENLRYPTDLLEDYRTTITQVINNREIEQALSPAKVEQYKITSLQKLSPVFQAIQLFHNTLPIAESNPPIELGGIRQLMDKSAFCENQGITHLNYDSITAEMAATRLAREFSLNLHAHVGRRYLIRQNDLRSALERLNPSTHYHIFLLGLSRQYLNNIVNFPHVTITEIPAVAYDSLVFHWSILIIPQTAMPWITHPELEQNILDELSLTNYDDTYNIYGAVVNLHENPNIRDMFVPENGQDLERSVGLFLSFRFLLSWPARANIWRLDVYDQYGPQAIPNDVNDIVALP